MVSGLVTTAASMPVDILKTRIQNMKIIDGKPEFNVGTHCQTAFRNPSSKHASAKHAQWPVEHVLHINAGADAALIHSSEPFAQQTPSRDHLA